MKQARHRGPRPAFLYFPVIYGEGSGPSTVADLRPPRTLGRTAESISPRVDRPQRDGLPGEDGAFAWRVCYAPHTGVLEPSDLRRGEGKRQVAAAARSRVAANRGCRRIAKFLASRAQATGSLGAHG